MLENLRAFSQQVDRVKPQTTCSENVSPTIESVSWHSSDDLRASIEPLRGQQYKLGDVLAVRSLNHDKIINVDDESENWADPSGRSGGRPSHCDVNHNDDGEGEEDMQGCEKVPKKGKGTKDRKGNGKETEDRKGKGKQKGKGNGKGKAIVEQTPGGDDISCAIVLQLQQENSEADYDRER